MFQHLTGNQSGGDLILPMPAPSMHFKKNTAREQPHLVHRLKIRRSTIRLGSTVSPTPTLMDFWNIHVEVKAGW